MERRQSWFSRLCDCRGVRASPQPDCCLDLSDEVVHHPDPAIYSQKEELMDGRFPLWNSPDITTNDWGPFLLRDTIDVHVTNLADKASAVNTLVHCYLAPFGIGMPFTRYASHMVTIPNSSAVGLVFALDSSVRDGEEQRLGVRITIEHPFDTDSDNNIGYQCIDGRQTSLDGRNFVVDIPVRNSDTLRSHTIRLQHSDEELMATLDWDETRFDPGEEKVVHVDITVPDSLHGTDDDPNKQHVTVIATSGDGRLIGGATIIARIDT